MPTVRITESSTGGTHTGASDTCIHSETPTHNHVGLTSLNLKPNASTIGVGIFRFVPPSLGAVTVTAVRFGIFDYNDYSIAVPCSIFACRRDPVMSQASYEEYATGSAWQLPGARGALDRDTTALQTQSWDPDWGLWVVWDSALLVTYAHTQVNAGQSMVLLLERSPYDATDSGPVITSCEGTDNQRPYLEFDYTTGGGSNAGPLVGSRLTTPHLAGSRLIY